MKYRSFAAKMRQMPIRQARSPDERECVAALVGELVRLRADDQRPQSPDARTHAAA